MGSITKTSEAAAGRVTNPTARDTVPRISVVMPCYNRAEYLEEALESALSQEGDFELLEVIVVDDHSDEPATIDLLSTIGARDGVRVLSNPGRRGPAAARNVGIRAARGDWVAFLDSDDVWLPGSLAARIRIVNSEPTCRWVAADYSKWCGGKRREPGGRVWSHPVSGSILRRARHDRRIRLERPVEQCVRVSIPWTGTVLVDRRLLMEVGGFEERLMKSEDAHLWIRLAARTDLWFVPEVLALYRQHGENTTAPADPMDDCTMRVFRMLLADPEFRPYRGAVRRRLARLWVRRGRYFRRQRQFAHAFCAYARSLGYAPLKGEGWRGLASSVVRRL